MQICIMHQRKLGRHREESPVWRILNILTLTVASHNYLEYCTYRHHVDMIFDAQCSRLRRFIYSDCCKYSAHVCVWTVDMVAVLSCLLSSQGHGHTSKAAKALITLMADGTGHCQADIAMTDRHFVTGLVNGGNLSLCVIVRDSSISIYWRP